MNRAVCVSTSCQRPRKRAPTISRKCPKSFSAPADSSHERATRETQSAASVSQPPESKSDSCSSTHHPTVGQLVLFISDNKTEVILDGEKRVIPTAVRTPGPDPVDNVRSVAKELSEPGFRVTAYTQFRYGRDRIKVEVHGGRTGTKRAWKIAKTSDTADEAIAFIKEAHRVLPKQGERE
jgi:hypothetical protein